VTDVPGASTEPSGQAAVTEPENSPAPGIASEISAQLAGLVDRPVEEHPEVYEDVHQRLRNTLSGIDHV
jgi:hypothetical protein